MEPITNTPRIQPAAAPGPAQDDLFWEADQRRDRAFDGHFFFGVLTTGVYCLPSCACRLPLRKNVRFFLDRDAAERAGLRPCLRCHPVDPIATRIQNICDRIRVCPGDPWPLADLAAQAGLSRFHFQRVFTAAVGLTPRQFVEASRLNSLKGNLRSRPSVTDAIYESGFGSSSRVYERIDTRLGMTPSQYREGGKQVVISYVAVPSALGRMMIGATDRGLCFIQFADRDEDLLDLLRAEYPAARIEPMREPYPQPFERWMTALRDHLSGQQPRLDLPLDLRATAFQMKVWRYLQSIPYGAVQSYAEVASGLGQPSAARAVAQACASNRVALVIPCHRVIRGTGELGGYRWGLDRKRVLIDQERSTKRGQERSATRRKGE
jgi:AraC family transcriptional regulator of adaptative response/methylated-DNA-[protein]-cysteine methyltransferase